MNTASTIKRGRESRSARSDDEIAGRGRGAGQPSTTDHGRTGGRSRREGERKPQLADAQSPRKIRHMGAARARQALKCRTSRSVTDPDRGHLILIPSAFSGPARDQKEGGLGSRPSIQVQVSRGPCQRPVGSRELRDQPAKPHSKASHASSSSSGMVRCRLRRRTIAPVGAFAAPADQTPCSRSSFRIEPVRHRTAVEDRRGSFETTRTHRYRSHSAPHSRGATDV